MISYVATLGTRMVLVTADDEDEARRRAARKFYPPRQRDDDPTGRWGRYPVAVSEILVRRATQADRDLLDHAAGSEPNLRRWADGLALA